MADIVLKLRDVTTSEDLFTESVPNPADGDPSGIKARFLESRTSCHTVQGALNIAGLGMSGRTGHTHLVSKDGVTIKKIEPELAFTQHVLRWYISGVLQETETFPAGEGYRLPYIARQQALKANQELNPTNTFTDLPT